jgi:hypothetical protein
MPINQRDLIETVWPDDDTDEYFRVGYVDVDEHRDLPTPHRYVHGGFRDTDTRFSMYLPEPGAYANRFYQHVTPVPQSEHLGPSVGAHNKITFAVDHGAYFLETNGGGGNAAGPGATLDASIGAFRASAAAARFSRRIVAEAYGTTVRPYGYLYGGSGGAYRTMGAAQQIEDVWDGFVPYVPGSPMAIPNVFSVRMHAQRILRDILPQIVDAYDAGGDPNELQLTADQASALNEVTRMGFPPRSWFGYRTMGMHAFSVLYPAVMLLDPTYADDFWSMPGYLGADPDSSVHADRVQTRTTVIKVERAADPLQHDVRQPTGGVDESYQHAGETSSGPWIVELADAVDGWVLGAQLRALSGTAAGTSYQLARVDGTCAYLEPVDGELALALGDAVIVDNSDFLAAQTYHRHQVPGAEYRAWDQFCAATGEPIYPQRASL